MSELTYPREWFSVSRWSEEPRAQTFIRETDRTLFYEERGRERRETKHGQYSTWYPSREQAEAAIAARKQRESEKRDAEEYRKLAEVACRAAGVTLDELRSGAPRMIGRVVTA